MSEYSQPLAQSKNTVSRPVSPVQKRKINWLVWIVLAVGVVAIVSCSVLRKPAQKKPAAPPAISVSTTPVKSGSIDVYLIALGTVTPVYTVTVTSRVAGQLAEIHYKEGQTVKKDDLLAVIDPRPYKAALTQAGGQLARDQALLKNAKIDMERYQSAFQKHAIPQQQLATQEALVEEDAGNVEVDKGNVEAAQVNVDYTQITSPIDGRVGLRQVDLGNIVAANGTTGLVTIAQIQPITVVFTLAEDDLGQVVQATNANPALRVDAFDRTQQTRLAQGEFLTVDNEINPTTGTVRAKATFTNAQNELFPNQFVNVKLFLKTLTNVNLVPSAALQRNNDAAFVYVVQPNGTAKSQNVKITATDGDVTAITGVNLGDNVVTDGFDKLQNGSKVTVRKPGAQQSPPQNNKSSSDAE